MDDKEKSFSSNSMQEQQQVTCFNCGEIFNKKNGHCSACGSPRPVCIVCFSEFRKKEVIIKLPCCSNYAHEEHIKNYLEIKGHCPKCHQEIKIEDLEEVTI
ncbi:MAG: hypothetical protein FK730_16165 [Asgard group archaeon]|nr:hypothetical protein [Asgard group archaeon]